MTESRIMTSETNYSALNGGNAYEMMATRKNHAYSGASAYSSGSEYDQGSPVGHTSGDTSAESLMAQIIRMNMIAEKSRQQIRDNMKIAQQLNMQH